MFSPPAKATGRAAVVLPLPPRPGPDDCVCERPQDGPDPLATPAEWCRTDPWGEDHADGARGLVTREDWLAPYAG
ncbi:MAG TPA: hypothetical protein VHM02_16205 [Thermoanaerobaculia bacterium]|nr:hypothetical protein [Thermoanaerobaculia bacterium]